MITLSDLTKVQPKWFSKENKRFFGDVSYRVLQGKTTKKNYLVRSTYAWTDMCGGTKTLHYRVNEINEDLTIGHLTDNIHKSLDDVKVWLKKN